MIIIGLRFFTWGSDRTPNPMQCGQCGWAGAFIVKKGMRFVTVFFIIPVIPISGVQHLVECPNCKTRYNAE